MEVEFIPLTTFYSKYRAEKEWEEKGRRVWTTVVAVLSVLVAIII